MDFSNNASHLQPRAVSYAFINSSYANATEGDPVFHSKDRSRTAFSSSRNPMIDTVIRPGPYKELLPCKDMCYNLTRSCPAALQFACPLEGHGLELDYGNPNLHPEGEITCNRPWTLINGAAGLRVTGLVAFSVALTAAFVTTAL